MVDVCRLSESISVLFFALFPIVLFEYIAKMSQKYGFHDWVAPTEVVDRDGKVSKRGKVETL